MISVNIPSKDDKRLHRVLLSIANSDFKDVEIIVNNFTLNPKITELCKKFAAIEIRKEANILFSRFLMSKESKGDFILLLDETRSISRNLLSELWQTHSYQAVISEIENGHSFYSRIANYEHESNRQFRREDLNPLTVRYILPRWYEKTLLSDAFYDLRQNLNKEVFVSLQSMDLELIYYETYQRLHEVDVIANTKILHDPDSSLLSIARKYFNYGVGTKKLRGTKYDLLGDLKGRSRRVNGNRSNIQSLVLESLRGGPFVFGYLIS